MAHSSPPRSNSVHRTSGPEVHPARDVLPFPTGEYRAGGGVRAGLPCGRAGTRPVPARPVGPPGRTERTCPALARVHSGSRERGRTARATCWVALIAPAGRERRGSANVSLRSRRPDAPGTASDRNSGKLRARFYPLVTPCRRRAALLRGSGSGQALEGTLRTAEYQEAAGKVLIEGVTGRHFLLSSPPGPLA